MMQYEELEHELNSIPCFRGNITKLTTRSNTIIAKQLRGRFDIQKIVPKDVDANTYLTQQLILAGCEPVQSRYSGLLFRNDKYEIYIGEPTQKKENYWHVSIGFNDFFQRHTL